jgi:hypothetical protein
MHSFAAWRALWHLLVKPDLWEKTPHGLVPALVEEHGTAAGSGAADRDAVPAPA